MKRKLLSILALLCLMASSAWADITVYATNTTSWSKIHINYWGGSSYPPSWPGAPMELVYTDGSGHKFYKATIPADVDGITFTNGAQSGTKQTEDITSGIADGAWWEVSGTSSYNAEYKGIVPHGNCGTSGHESEVTWILTEDEVLIISGTGAMADYGYSSNVPWYSYRTSITSINISAGVTSIGDNAFNGCNNASLTSVTIPSDVNIIGNNAFRDCNALTSVTLSSSGLNSIGNNAFFNCSNLASITIPDGLTTIGNNAFYGCKISSINIPSSVTSIGSQALLNCSLLSSITVDSNNANYSSDEDGVLFNKDKTRIIQYPIARNRYTYTLPATVTHIDAYAFYRCDKLTSFNVPNGVTTIGGRAFYGCINLASVTLNSNPSIGTGAFDAINPSASVTMRLTANEGATGEYWTTFYNENYKFEVPANTQIFKAALSGTALALTELIADKRVMNNNAVILKSDVSTIVLTLTLTNSSNNFNDNDLSGVSSASGLTANGTHFVLNKKENGVGFYRMNSGNTIGVGKAYLTYSGALAPDFLRFEDEEENATDLLNFSHDSNLLNSVKIFRDGKLYILRDGVTYDALGKRIK